MDTPKTRIFALAKSLDLSEGYGVLLYLTALLEFDPSTLVPQSEEERMDWQGHLRGLHAALQCLLMYETQCTPQKAARMVNKHLTEATALFVHGADPGSGE